MRLRRRLPRVAFPLVRSLRGDCSCCSCCSGGGGGGGGGCLLQLPRGLDVGSVSRVVDSSVVRDVVRQQLQTKATAEEDRAVPRRKGIRVPQAPPRLLVPLEPRAQIGVEEGVRHQRGGAQLLAVALSEKHPVGKELTGAVLEEVELLGCMHRLVQRQRDLVRAVRQVVRRRQHQQRRVRPGGRRHSRREDLCR